MIVKIEFGNGIKMSDLPFDIITIVVQVLTNKTNRSSVYQHYITEKNQWDILCLVSKHWQKAILAIKTPRTLVNVVRNNLQQLLLQIRHNGKYWQMLLFETQRVKIYWKQLAHRCKISYCPVYTNVVQRYHNNPNSQIDTAPSLTSRTMVGPSTMLMQNGTNIRLSYNYEIVGNYSPVEFATIGELVYEMICKN